MESAFFLLGDHPTLNEHGVEHEKPIDVVCWTDEEGSRFGAGCVGSNALWDDGALKRLQDERCRRQIDRRRAGAIAMRAANRLVVSMSTVSSRFISSKDLFSRTKVFRLAQSKLRKRPPLVTVTGEEGTPPC